MNVLFTGKIVILACAVLLSTTSISAQDSTSTGTEVMKLDDRSAPYNGFGLNFGVTIFIPKEVNTMINDIYDELKSGYYMISEIGTPDMFMGESFKLKGVFYLNHHFALEPYGQVFWAGKYLYVSGAENSAWVHLLFYSGGLNFWIRVNPEKLVSFKTGIGGFEGYSQIEVTGDAGRVSLKGNGFGANILAGIDITFSKTVINLDFTVPVGMIKYQKRKGSLSIGDDGYQYNYYDTDQFYSVPSSYRRYPKKVLLAGFEFRPGVTFRF